MENSNFQIFPSMTQFITIHVPSPMSRMVHSNDNNHNVHQHCNFFHETNCICLFPKKTLMHML
uniref:Uncharacterized protein n=1 Tax=Rhizophora mucronata TaxID=61149 RepID=A0A2P2N148_RHIMU